MGVNMSLMLVFAFIIGTTNLFMGRLSLRDLSIYVGGLSLIYRVVFYLASLIASGQKVNVSIGQLILGPILDLVVAYVFFLPKQDTRSAQVFLNEVILLNMALESRP